MSSEISQEFESQRQFRIELPNPRTLYDVLDHGHQRQTQPEKFKTYFKIGTSHSEDELFSQINVRVRVIDSSYMRGEHVIDEDIIGGPSLLHAMLQQVYRQELNELVDNPRDDRTPSSILIRPLAPISPNPFEDAFPAGRVDLTDDSQEFKTFTKQTQNWAQFIEDAVNAMSKVKGIPQSGKLTLLPPSEIPQL